MDRNAVESWLLRMFAHAQSRGDQLDWTFYCHLTDPGSAAGYVRDLGGRVIATPVPLSDKRGFALALRQELKFGDYDVLHAHHDVLNGFYFGASIGCPLKRRICHIHNADEHVPVSGAGKTAVLRATLRSIIFRMADRIVGISDHTLDRFIQWRPRNAERDRVHYYGVDPTHFQILETTPQAFRAEIGLPVDARILLFGARLVDEKNPLFAADIFAELYRRDPRTYLVVAGSGSLTDAMVARCASLGVADRVRMLGWRNDLPRIMQCCDLFVLARPEDPPEGFGLTMVEAQLAGLRMLLSTGIPDDPLLPSATVRRLSLARPVDDWATAAEGLLNAPKPDRSVALQELKRSPMDMDYALDNLIALQAGTA
jgi:glycosyltransferase EpsF